MWYIGVVKKHNEVLETYLIRGDKNESYDFIEKQFMNVYDGTDTFTFDFKHHSDSEIIEVSTLKDVNYIVSLK